MLQIIIDKSYTLQLPEGFSLRMIDENPLFLNERIPMPHTIAFEVPLTPENMLFFKFPDRVTTQRIFQKYKMDIYHFGSIVMEGEVKIISVDKTIKMQFINAYLPENVKKKMNQIDFDENDYGTIPANKDDLFYSDAAFDDYKAAVYNSVFDPENFVTAPVRIKDVDWDGHEASWGLKNALRMYINYFNPVNNNWTFPRREEGEYNPFDAECIFPVIPMPYLHWVLDYFFDDLLETNPFYVDEQLRKLVVANFSHINFNVDNFCLIKTPVDNDEVWAVFPLVDDYTPDEGEILNKTENKNFFQAYPFNEFLKNILTLFGMTAYIGKKISFEYNNDLLDTEDIVNLSEFVINKPIVSYEEGKIYNLTYGEEKTEEINVETIEGGGTTWVAAYLDLLSSPELTKNYKIWGMPNAVYELTKQAKGIDTSGGQVQSNYIIKCVQKTKGLSTAKIDDTEKEIFDVRVEVKPMEIGIEFYWNEHYNYAEAYIKKYHWVVPLLSEKDLNSPPRLMIDLGVQPTVTSVAHNYRQLSNNYYNSFGTPAALLSLLINETDPQGVFLKYHKKMADWYLKDKIKISVDILLTALQLKKISNKQKIHINGKNFFILKREYDMSSDRYISVTFDLIEV